MRPLNQIRKAFGQDLSGDPEFQVAPMVDVLLVLLIFFISITSTEVLRRSRDLDLPESPNSKWLDKAIPQQAVINLKWLAPVRQTLITLDGKTYISSVELASRLRERAITNPEINVLLRADKEVEYRYIAQIISVCSAADIRQIHFATIGGSPESEKK